MAAYEVSQKVQFARDFRLCVRHRLYPDPLNPPVKAVSSSSNSLSQVDFTAIFLPLLCRYLPREAVRYHSLHIEFLGDARYGEEIELQFRVEKHQIGKSWKVVTRCLNKGGEYLCTAEIAASPEI